MYRLPQLINLLRANKFRIQKVIVPEASCYLHVTSVYRGQVYIEGYEPEFGDN